MTSLTAAVTRVRTGNPVIPLGIALAVVYVVWGSTFYAIKIGLETIPPLLMGGVRFLLAGGALYLWAIRRGDRSDRPTARHWREAFVLGFLMLVCGNGTVTIAETRIDSSIAALLVAMVPLWIAVIDRVGWGAPITRGTIAGLVVGFTGVAILIDPFGATVHTPSALLILVGSVGWAYGSLRSRDSESPGRPLVWVAMQMLAAGALFMVGAALGGEFGKVDPAAISVESVGAVVYLAVFGSIVAFTAYVWLLRNASASLVSTYAYVNPVIAVLLGGLLLGERLTATTGLAGLTIVAAVALIVSSRGRRDTPASPPATCTGVEPEHVRRSDDPWSAARGT